MARIVLNKQNHTIKVVNRTDKISLKRQLNKLSLTHNSGRRGPQGAKGDPGSPGEPFHIGLFADSDNWHIDETITVAHNLGTKFIQPVFFNIYDVPEQQAHEESFNYITFAYDEAHMTSNSWTPIDDNTIKIRISYGTQLQDDGNGNLLHVSIAVDAAIIFAGQKGVKGDTGTSTMVRLVHADDPNAARPDAEYVEWMGSVAPNYATAVDTWIVTPSL